MKTTHVLFAVFVSSFISVSSAFPQGSLTPPPGAPAATMKTLDQIRSTGTAINATNTPGDANYHFVINAAGSYFVTGNLGVTKTSGIHVTSAGVTVDLNGFQISRSSSSGGTGILIDAAAYRAVVENGSIAGFATGVTAAPGGVYARGGAFEHLSVTACTSVGIDGGDGWRIEHCQAHDNSGVAIRFHDGATVLNCNASSNTGASVNTVVGGTGGSLTNCVVQNNHCAIALLVSGTSTLNNCVVSNNATVTAGVQTSGGASLINCSVNSNSGSAASSYGIYLNGSGCLVSNCDITSNSSTNGSPTSDGGDGLFAAFGDTTVKACTVNANTGNGLNLHDRCSVIHCTASTNGYDGIVVGDESSVTDCTADANGLGAGVGYGNGCLIRGNTVCENLYGLYGFGANNRVDGNQAYKNVFFGIEQSATDADFTMRNVSFRNGSNNYYPVTSGTYFGPFSTPGTATASPWANF